MVKEGAHPLAPFGYNVNKLQVPDSKGNSKGRGLACAEDTPAGKPLLAIPLAACWTAQAAQKECPELKQAATARGAEANVSQTDWIALHLLRERHLGQESRTDRREYLKLLPEVFETLLSWSSDAIEILQDTPWHQEAESRQAQVAADFRSLTEAFGENGTNGAHLTLEGYRWARNVIQQFGMHFVAADGAALEVLVPGLELLEPARDVPPSTDGARLVYEGAPAVVIYSNRDYKRGDSVTFYHNGLACSNGFMLIMGRPAPEPNPADHVEVKIQLPIDRSVATQDSELFQGLVRALKDDLRTGDSMPPDVAEGWVAVALKECENEEPELRINLRFAKDRLVPSADVLGLLSGALLAHKDRVKRIMREEAGSQDVLRLAGKERRALSYLQERLQVSLMKYPSLRELRNRFQSVLQQVSKEGLKRGEAFPRALRALCVVEKERQTVLDALGAVEKRLAASPIPSEEAPEVPLMAPVTGTPLEHMSGATWDEVQLVKQLGFAVPVLCDVFWRSSPSLAPGDSDTSLLGQYKKCAVELQGCPCHSRIRRSLREALDCRIWMSFEGKPRRLSAAIAGCDVVVVPVFTTDDSKILTELLGEVLSLFQVIMEEVTDSKHPMRVVLLTSGACGPSYSDFYSDQEPVSKLPKTMQDKVPTAALLTGLVRSVRAETPHMPVLCIDSDSLGLDLASQVATELAATLIARNASVDDKVAALLDSNREISYRDGARYTPAVDVSSLAPVHPSRSLTPLKLDGVAVVTGGTGGVGLIAAVALAEVGVRCLVLTCKSGEFFKGPGVMDRFQQIERLGATVSVEKCDTSNESDVRMLLSRVRGEHGPLKIVLHASGLHDDKILQEQDEASLDKVFRPKAYGAYFLHKYTLEDNLHSFLLFSSVAALLGEAGQVNYAAANTYLDELAMCRARQGLPAVSIQWPPVEDTTESARSRRKARARLDVATAKQAVKQIVCSLVKVHPVQAMLTEAVLDSAHPTINSFFSPLFERMERADLKLEASQTEI